MDGTWGFFVAEQSLQSRAMATARESNGLVSFPLWKGMATMAAAMTLALTIHSRIVVPGILAEARKEAEGMIDARIDRHEQRPHQGAVSRSELNLILDRLKSIDSRLERMESSWRSPEKR